MKPTRLLFLLMLAMPMAALAQTRFDVEVSNPMQIARKDAPVTCRVTHDVRSALVTLNGQEIPCQLDDLNGDGLMDELFFLADIGPQESQTYNVELYVEGSPRRYEPRVYVEMMLTNKKIKETNKQDLYISQLTVDRGVNPYWMLHHHGAAFESELVAYRIYFDHRQTVDIYGKYRQGLELHDTQFYPNQAQKDAGFGDDVLWVGNTLGVGTLRGWDGQQPTMVQDVEQRSQRIVSRGPLRTIVEVKAKGWVPQAGQEPIDMTQRYTLVAGHRDCAIDISFSPNASKYQFATGLINVKNSTECFDKRGMRGCWGTDWPVSEKDSAGHKRETVGLGISVPSDYVVGQVPATKDNYTFVVKPVGNTLHYDVVFGSDNESFGFHSEKEWFAFLKEWKQQLLNPVRAEAKSK
ncbi:MAG: DUF4861 domain-containing protein [Prevotella sp.]|nr:DUF4861 domain-containing protein [Prevotella sp.]